MYEFWRFIVNLISIYDARGSVYRSCEFHIYLIRVAIVVFHVWKIGIHSVSRYTRITFFFFFFWTSLWYKYFTSKLIYRTRKYWHPLSSFTRNIPLFFFLSSMNVVHWCTWEIDSTTNISFWFVSEIIYKFYEKPKKS